MKITMNHSKGGSEMQTKSELRKMILEQRRQLPEEEVYALSAQICNKVKELQEYKEAEDICLYMPANNEVDLTLLIEDAWSRGVTEITLDATEEGRPLYNKLGFTDSRECMVLNK